MIGISIICNKNNSFWMTNKDVPLYEKIGPTFFCVFNFPTPIFCCIITHFAEHSKTIYYKRYVG